MKVIVLAGGCGSRLFPLSREEHPKQFLKLLDSESFFQKTLKRCLSFSSPEDIIIVTNNRYRKLVEAQLSECFGNTKSFNIVFEPEARNTAPAITLGVVFALDKLGARADEVFIVLPSDHFISPEGRFTEYVNVAKQVAQQGYIVTFGITPTKPETGYGYIEAGEKIHTNGCTVFKVQRFHEKPDSATAKGYLSKGSYYWNSGIFTFRADTFLEELRKYAEDIYSSVKEKSFSELLSTFGKLPSISIDHALMEKTSKAVVVPMDIVWSDVGSWESVYKLLPKDTAGNAKVGNILSVDSSGSIIINSEDGKTVVVLGVKDLIVVDTGDVLLITQKGNGQRVKDVVNLLE